MKITSQYQYNNPVFKGAIVNMNVFSDTHGNVEYANNALEEMRVQKNDIFCKEKKGSTNIFAVIGDWFIDGARRGFSVYPNKDNAFFQLDMLNGFFKEIKNITGNDIKKIFTPGNHEFDGGVKLLDTCLSQLDADILMTNLDIENSHAFCESKNKLFNEKIVEVDDDKNPNIKNKILILGISPVNMYAYQKNLDGVEFTDNINKPSKSIKKNEYTNTLNECKKRISQFKKTNPNGMVILLNHTGVDFADNLANESQINIIFDGHEHKDEVRIVNGVPIVALSQNFKKIVNSRFIFDDDGKLQQIKLKNILPFNNSTLGPLDKLYHDMFAEDIAKKYSITSSDENNDKLDILDVKNVRVGNNYLANFITDAILSELKKFNPDIDFFALNSSSIRSSLKLSKEKSVSNLDIMNTLSGIRDDEAQIMITEVSGSELLYLIKDNIIFNKKSPNRNTLIQYSGLIIDRTSLLKAIEEGKNEQKQLKCIIDARTKKPILSDKIYTISNPEKYFDKNINQNIKNLKSKSQYTGKNVKDLFKSFFESSDGHVSAKCDIRIK